MYELCEAENITLSNKGKSSAKKEYQLGLWQDKVSIMKPSVFMNNSGAPIAAYARSKNIESSQMLVIHDELDFPCGKARFKFGGSEGGNNGLKSISASYGSKDYWRLRIGISRPIHKTDVTNYVLSSPSPAEKDIYRGLVPLVISAINEFVWGNKEIAMQNLHSANLDDLT